MDPWNDMQEDATHQAETVVGAAWESTLKGTDSESQWIPCSPFPEDSAQEEAIS